MRYRWYFFLLFVCLLTQAVPLYAQDTPNAAMTFDYVNAWARVDSLEQRGLPASARTVVDSIYAAAKAEGAEAQFIKALLYQSKYKVDLEEDAANTIVADIRGQLDAATPVGRALLHSILGELFVRYYQANRYRFYNRTATTVYDEDDLETWDLTKIITEATEQYLRSVEPADTLKAYPVEDYEVLLQAVPDTRALRPTLYDFLAHRAITFFTNEEAGLITPDRAFILQDDAYFEPAQDFIERELPQQEDPGYVALRLLQDLLAFHLERDEPAALLDVDLERLGLVSAHSVAPARDSLYVASLERLRTQYDGSPLSAEVTFALAQEYVRRGGQYQPYPGTPTAASEADRLALRTAHALCESAAAQYPQTIGGSNCRALLAQIENRRLTFQAGEVLVPGRPSLVRIDYRNLDTVYVKAVPVTREEKVRFDQAPYQERQARLRAFAGRSGVFGFTVALPDDGDYQQHTTEMALPALARGAYMLFAGSDPAYTMEREIVAYTFLQVSTLSYVARRMPDGAYDLYVLDRTSGDPLPDVRIRIRYGQRNITDLFDRTTFRTNRNGYVRLRADEQRSFSLYLDNDRDTLQATEQLYNYRSRDGQTSGPVTHFFTDRAIYRPGQTIYFKGIAMHREGERYEIAPGTRAHVRLMDVNYQEVAALDLVANDYGTFSGSFTAPQGGLTGQMSITDDNGQVYFSVEEYKRPRFEVRLDSLAGTPFAGDTVTVTGVATSYAGAGLDGAQVAYRVVRVPRFRLWYWGPPPQIQEVEIARGVVETASDGTFALSFPALPDLTLPRETNPLFNFRISVDVTDITGETHSAETNVVVGYTALALSLGVPARLDKTDPPPIRITSENLNGTFAPLAGRLVVTRLATPDRLLRPRLWEAPDRYTMDRDTFVDTFPHHPYAGEDDASTWAVEDTVLILPFDTAEQQAYALDALREWPSGVYRFALEAEDPTGQPLRVRQEVTLYASDETRLPYPVLDWFVPVKASGEPGERAVFLVGTGAPDTQVLFEVEHQGEITVQRWLTLSDEQQRLEIPIEEKHRGNFVVHTTFVRFNRAFRHTETVVVPYTNKQLKLTLATFRDRLKPGSQEEWKIKISGPEGEAVAAELVASMYDASLDAFRPHDWAFDILSYYYARLRWGTNSLGQVAQVRQEGGREDYYGFTTRGYDQLNWFGFNYFGDRRPPIMMRAAMAAPPPGEGVVAEADDAVMYDAASMEEAPTGKAAAPEPEPDATEAGALADVQARRNLNETAFFFPQLETNEQGEVLLSFTMPEALTRWRMLAFAHTKDLKYGQLRQEVVTQKELMVTPNAPRFFREADTLAFTAKVANLSDTLLAGRAQLMLFDALTMEPVDAVLGNTDAVRSFSVAPGGSEAFRWMLTIPESVQAVTYRVVAEAGAFTDGEEAVVPVLTNRMLVTETLPLPVRGDETKTFHFDKLRDLDSPTLRNYRLTLEYTPNPVWYAVQALPYMMEFPYECAEQVFSRYYANSIAAHIVAQNPAIERVYEAWRRAGADALVSNLEKNQELKGLLLEATPWVLDAQDETARKERIALLFDANHMRNERDRALRKLRQMQDGNGAWPWFDGMPSNRYITQHVVAGMGHLMHLGVLSGDEEDRNDEMLSEAVRFLDAQMQADYERLLELKVDMTEQHVGPIQVQYFYARSFFPDVALDNAYRKAFDYYLGQLKTYWLSQNTYMQGMAALALDRHGEHETAMDIIRSLKEYALHSEEMGMYWKRDLGYFWYQAPIETQAMLIEAFHEVAGDEASVEEMKQWLLKQKQTQDWGTTKATAEATYALLLRGTDLTAASSNVVVRLGDHVVDAEAQADAEAGTGYFKTSWSGDEITPDMGNITVEKEGKGIAWGAVYWQYFEQLDRITPHETPLRLEKSLFLERKTDTGPLLVPVDASLSLAPGDLVKVRIVLHVDRDMEFVHMQDMRAAGLEPLNVLSQYKYQDGLGYYESTRDAATHFFFGYLPKGTYVFEYPLRVNHAGAFSNGITTIQCMYAPEFTAHSEGTRLRVGGGE